MRGLLAGRFQRGAAFRQGEFREIVREQGFPHLLIQVLRVFENVLKALRPKFLHIGIGIFTGGQHGETQTIAGF